VAQSTPADTPAAVAAGRPRGRRRRFVVGGISIYLLLPSLLSLYGAWPSLAHLDWPFTLLALVAGCASYVCLYDGRGYAGGRGIRGGRTKNTF
jgi:hypothetical protein